MNLFKLTALSLFLGQSLLLAGEFSYHLRDVGSLWPTECNLKAFELGKRFESFTGKRVLSSRCEVDTLMHETNLELRYEADKPLNKVTTSKLFPVGSAKGVYSTKEKCEEKLSQHVEIFERETGLRSFFPFCYREKYVDSLPWAIHIDAFGDAVKKPMLGAVRTDAAPKDKNWNEFYSEFQDALAKEGATLDWLTIRTTSPHNAIVFLYYAEKEILFGAKLITGGLPLAICGEHKPTIREAFDKAGGNRISMFCGSRYNPSKMHEMWVIYFDVHVPKFSIAEENFKKYEECVAQRPALEAKYKEQYGWPITGSICGFDERLLVRLNFIEKSQAN